MYVATGATILRYDLTSGLGTTFATGLNRPTGLAFGPDAGLFAALHDVNAILKFDPASGSYTTFASGNELFYPEDLAVFPDGSTLYSANYNNSTIFKFDLSSGVQSTFATRSPMNGTYGLAFTP
jgi:DNA-binding beta-propeller fold protein YncE